MTNKGQEAAKKTSMDIILAEVWSKYNPLTYVEKKRLDTCVKRIYRYKKG